ncbi:MAG: hypothetical protein Q9170_004924 [Blastenia crenularia]
MTTDPFDELFELENIFCKEGYELGVQDGTRAGRIEGRLFGLEKGFDKYIAMGKLHARSVVWSGRIASPQQRSDERKETEDQEQLSGGLSAESQLSEGQDRKSTRSDLYVQAVSSSLPQILYNPRLEKHIRTLYALTEPASLSTDNSEDAVSDFDDRLKRADGKVKIIEKLVGEVSTDDDRLDASNVLGLNKFRTTGKQDGGIEDINVLRARH